MAEPFRVTLVAWGIIDSLSVTAQAGAAAL